MKNVHTLLLLTLCLAACHKKTIPEKTNSETTVPGKTIPEKTEPATAIPAPVESVPAAPLPAAMIVIDGYGRVLTPVDKLPDPKLKPDYSQIARSFTPQQLANLKARYKTVPPKVLYVPEQYTKKSSKGTYCIYKKKFWYWKKADGLFYLDETYYL